MEFHKEFKELFPYGILDKEQEKIARKAWQSAIDLVRYGPQAVKKTPALFQPKRKEATMHTQQTTAVKQKLQRTETQLDTKDVQFLRQVLRQVLRMAYDLENYNKGMTQVHYVLAEPYTTEGREAFELLNASRNIVRKNKAQMRKLESIQRKLAKMM